MRTYNNSIVVQFDTTGSGNSGSGKLVSVFDAGTTDKADLFDSALLPIANPVQADDSGNYTFTIDDGTYDLYIDFGLPTQTEILDEQISNTVNNPPLSPGDNVIAFDVLQGAIDDTNPLKIFNGAALNIAGRTTKNDGAGSLWDVVLASTVTPNTYNIVQCVGINTLALVLRDDGFADVRKRGATGNAVTDDSGAIQNAIDSGLNVFFPPAQIAYNARNLTQTDDDQVFSAPMGARINKGGDGLLFSGTGRALVFKGIKFYGHTSHAGGCLKVTGDNCVFEGCSVWTTEGDALHAEGNGARIIGTNDIYYSDDPLGFGIHYGNSSTDTLYGEVVGMRNSSSTGGIKFERHSAGSIVACQTGSIDFTSGAGYINSCRIVGDCIFHKGFTVIDNVTIAGDVTIGDGITTISGVGFGRQAFMQSGGTFTLNSVRESSINTGQLTGITIADFATGSGSDVDNTYISKPIAYTPSWTGATTDPVLGDGVIDATYIRKGRTVQANIKITMGSTTTFGSGAWRFSLPVLPTGNSQGGAVLFEAGTQYWIGISTTNTGQGYATIAVQNGGDFTRSNIPFIWSSGDVLSMTLDYQA